MVDWWYYNNLFGVEDGLFYENNKRLGYYQDEKEDKILKNNHKATVDRMLELRELNIEFKRINNKLKKENKELEEENEQLKSDAVYWGQNAEARLKEIDKLRKEKEQLKDTLAFRSNQLALMENLIDDLGTDEMCREMEDILNG